MKQTFNCKKILLKDGWQSNVTIEVDSGKIISINKNQLDNVSFEGIYIPGFLNAHSHSFQYAMAGLAEVHQSHNSDDFWSWREAMYNIALQLNPDQFESVATKLYAEMLKHGWTNVAEFHYVHHDKNGERYSSLSEMGQRVISAAKKVGINITLIPIFYQKGGFGTKPTEKQRRFISPDLNSYLTLLEESEKATQYYEGANIATGVHSLRGVDPKIVKELTQQMNPNHPFHIHISEQLKEVEDAMNYLNQRPVEWLLDNCDVNQNYHLVHATHLTPEEVSGIAKSGANVVICPSTEGNLGDGIFPLIDFQNKVGKWSIGTDSHIGLSPMEELRILDYGQRLTTHKRNIFTDKKNTNSSHFALEKTTLSGKKAMGEKAIDFFNIGEYFNACVIDEKQPLIASSNNDNLLSAFVYSGDRLFIEKVITQGIVRIQHQQIDQDLENEINQKFIKTCKEVGIR